MNKGGRVVTSAVADEPYDAFLMQLADEASLLEGVVGSHTNPVAALSHQAWLRSLPDAVRPLATSAEIWTAGATAMFQALVERGFIAPHEVEDALQATADVLTT